MHLHKASTHGIGYGYTIEWKGDYEWWIMKNVKECSSGLS